MEGFARAIIASLFVALVILGIFVLVFSFLGPLRAFEKVGKKGGAEVPAVGLGETTTVPGVAPSSSLSSLPQEGGTETPPPLSSQPPSAPPPSQPPPPSFQPTPIGTSPVNSSGEVVTLSGEPAMNSAMPGSGSAPAVSRPLGASEYPRGSVVLTFADGSVSPGAFTIDAGKALTIVVTSGDSETHVFVFDDPSLAGVAVGVGPKEARAITFNAPTTAGDYAFHCDVPGHRYRGETGAMQVK